MDMDASKLMMATSSCRSKRNASDETIDDISDSNRQGHQFGNFHSYYKFHPTSSRLRLMSDNYIFYKIWQSQGEPDVFSLLDIGCNEGDLSYELYIQAKNEIPPRVKCILLGIDLDTVLIDRAISKFGGDDNVSFRVIDIVITDEETCHKTLGSFLRDHGSTTPKFSFISLFSITMWVHLNHGDEGLTRLIRSAASLSAGSVLIESQPWHCYKSATKRCKKLDLGPFPFPHAALQLKDPDTAVFEVMGKSLPTRVYWSLGRESWGRSIVVFHSSSHEALLQLQQQQIVGMVEENATRGTTISVAEGSSSIFV